MVLIKRAFGLLLASAFTASSLCSAEPPPNDNFANRIVLTGNDITFTGTVAGATSESTANAWEVGYFSSCPAWTVWWSWTATQNSPVVLQALDSPKDFTCGGSIPCMTVWPAPNPAGTFPLATNQAEFSWLTSVSVQPGVPQVYKVFAATNAETYYF